MSDLVNNLRRSKFYQRHIADENASKAADEIDRLQSRIDELIAANAELTKDLLASGGPLKAENKRLTAKAKHTMKIANQIEAAYGRCMVRIELLEAVVEAEWDLVGVLEQTLLAIPSDGNLAIIGVAKNAMKHHTKMLAAVEDKT